MIYRASSRRDGRPVRLPGRPRDRQTPFDGGEYLFGAFANSLELGCDCVGDITYLDAVV